MKSQIGALLLLPALALALGGCASGTPVARAMKPSAVNLFLTDTPASLPGLRAINVTLGSIKLYPTQAGTGDEGGIELGSGPISRPGNLTLNLLDFQNGRVTFVGSQAVPPGSYSRFRLEVVSAEIVRDADLNPATPDVRESIAIPSGNFDVPVLFTVTAGRSLGITIDFDAQASIHADANTGGRGYSLHPVINVAGVNAG